MRGRVGSSTVRITAFPDRLHAGGAHQSQGSMSLLLRRASQWADIADYPEPASNMWERQRNAQIRVDPEMLSEAARQKSRVLLDMKKVERFHRLVWMARTSPDRDVKDMRVKDETTPTIDPMIVTFVFDVDSSGKRKSPRVTSTDASTDASTGSSAESSTGSSTGSSTESKDKSAKKSSAVGSKPQKDVFFQSLREWACLAALTPRIEEQAIRPFLLFSTSQHTAAEPFLPSLNASVLPPSIRLLGASRPFSARNEVVVQLENVQQEGKPEPFSICALFRNMDVKVRVGREHDVQAFKEVDITGLLTNIPLYKRQTAWFPKQRMPAVCNRIVIQPGMIRSFSFSF